MLVLLKQLLTPYFVLLKIQGLGRFEGMFLLVADIVSLSQETLWQFAWLASLPWIPVSFKITYFDHVNFFGGIAWLPILHISLFLCILLVLIDNNNLNLFPVTIIQSLQYTCSASTYSNYLG